MLQIKAFEFFDERFAIIVADDLELVDKLLDSFDFADESLWQRLPSLSEQGQVFFTLFDHPFLLQLQVFDNHLLGVLV